MINQSAQYIYYISYVIVSTSLLAAYLKSTTTAATAITTKEFKAFQTSFLTGYSLMILCELLSTASFYQTYVALNLTLEQITKLYVITLVSTTGCGILTEIVDVGTRKNKCILSGILYTISMLTICGWTF